METALTISTQKRLRGETPSLVKKCGLFKKRYVYCFDSLAHFRRAGENNKDVKYKDSKFEVKGVIVGRG
jgi:hypothetical protein